MYQEQFRQANKKIKMDKDFKENLLKAMEQQVERKSKVTNSLALRKVAVVGVLVLMFGAVTVAGAAKSGWKESMNQFFNFRTEKQYKNIDDENFWSDDQLEHFGKKVDISSECDGLKVTVTRLMADKYDIYGILELVIPEDMKFYSDHKKNQSGSYYLGMQLEPSIKYDEESKEWIDLLNTESATSFQLEDEDANDNKISFAFFIDTQRMNDVEKEEGETDSFYDGRYLSVNDFGSYCECETCIKLCEELNKILYQWEIKLDIPDNFEHSDEYMFIEKSCQVKANYWEEEEIKECDAKLENFVITPFSIRCKYTPEKGDAYISPEIIFEDGSKCGMTSSVIVDDDSYEYRLYAGEFPKPVNMKKIKAIRIGSKEIDMKNNE